ncbi:cytochrome c [Horticoccus luteus]|uniref:Cytochrome c n=1 Tax=Horticoccus luteus TaxID=2862869 RepID=A0A8F9TX86_9BACT|nr:cytochrome c [Horticoccus luteus]QYM79805.1 cytochrome c [Horticoccus luteus]
MKFKPDTKAHYALMPLAIVFVFSAFIFIAGTYVHDFSGHFAPSVFDETGLPIQPGSGATAKVDPLVLGRRQFDSACVTCHQATGLGIPGVYPPLAGSEWVDGSEERVISIVLHGLKGKVHVKGAEFGAAVMPAFGQVPGSGYNWSDEKIAAVLTFIRQEWGNKAGPITAAKVAELRTKEGSRGEWSEEELLKLP